VLHLAAAGYTSAQIAERLFLSPRTVETHRANLMRKLGLHNQSELTRFAIQHGLLSVDLPEGEKPDASDAPEPPPPSTT
jgi:DNA-binding NarL/FixJ family response regulator